MARWLATLSVALLVAGCASSTALAPEQPLADTDRQVTILLRDGRLLRLEAGHYTVSPADSGRIAGKGRLLTTGALNEFGKPWEGSVTLAEIDQITVLEDTAFGKVSRTFIVASVALFALMVLAAGSTRWY